MRTQVQESSILAYYSMSNKQKTSVADLIFEVIELNQNRGGNGMSMAEIQQFLKKYKVHIEKSTISARINEMVTCARLYRADYMRRCSITGKSIHPVSLPMGQMRLL